MSRRQKAPSVPRGPQGFGGNQAEVCAAERRWPARVSVIKDFTKPGSAMSPRGRPYKSADRALLLGPKSAVTAKQPREDSPWSGQGWGDRGRVLSVPGPARCNAPGPHKP